MPTETVTRVSKWEARLSSADRVPLRWFCLCCLLLFPWAGFAQDGEVVANFAAGRVIFVVAKDAIIFATIENKIEPESRGPQIVQISDKRFAILLGAAEWVTPDSNAKPIHLEDEIPALTRGIAGPKRMQQDHENDLEELGIGFLEPLRKAAARLHNKITMRKDEPLVELLLVGYLENYGPEVWSLRYRMTQDPLRGEYWQTRVLRPAYNQLYPPEKGEPRLIMEAAFPPPAPEGSESGDDAPTLLALLKRNDPKLGPLRNALSNLNEPAGRAWAALEKGESHKAKGDDMLALMRAALGATVPADTPLAIGLIREVQTHEKPAFEWIIPPPKLSTPQQRAEDSEKREPGAPTLRKKPPAH